MLQPAIPFNPLASNPIKRSTEWEKQKYFVRLQTSIGYGICSNMETSFSEGYQHTLVQADQDP